MVDFKPIIAKNIINLRKSMNLTQAELAKKLNYSDKAISKWERAESIPDVTVLKEIVDMFGVTMDYLLEEEHKKFTENCQTITKQKGLNHLIVSLLSTTLVFLIATVVFVYLKLNSAQLPMHRPWIIYIYAIPLACVVLLVFNSIWGKRRRNFEIITSILWGILLSVYLTFIPYNIWLIFIIGIPSQVIIFLWANLKIKYK